MALSAQERRRLIARGHRLKAALTVAADHVADSTILHVRRFLAEHELAKVRIRADTRLECEQAAAELAEQVPCEIVTRVGRVVLFYRPKDAGNDSEVPSVI